MPQGNVDNIVQAKEEINSSEQIELYHQIEGEFFEKDGDERRAWLNLLILRNMILSFQSALIKLMH